eukprot:scaffold271_cov336-Pavlova_lutheri.AAC.7
MPLVLLIFFALVSIPLGWVFPSSPPPEGGGMYPGISLNCVNFDVLPRPPLALPRLTRLNPRPLPPYLLSA